MARTEYLARALMWRDGRVLVCRDLKHGHAYLPGGHVESDESAAEAAMRELDEECGLAGRVGQVRVVWEARFVQQGVAKQEVSVVFHVEPPAEGAWPAEVGSWEPHIAFEWVDPAAAAAGGVVPLAFAEWLATQPPCPAQSGADWLSIDESA